MTFDRTNMEKTIKVYDCNGKFLNMTTPKRAYKLCNRKIAKAINNNSIQLLPNCGKAFRQMLIKEYSTDENRYCYICGKHIPDNEEVTIDHLIPKREGGTDELSNLKPCCKTCNNSKNHMSIKEFVLKLNNGTIILDNINRQRTQYLMMKYVHGDKFESLGVDCIKEV